MSGDRDAFAELAVRIGDDLFAVGRRILRDADLAEDAVQQTLLQIWRQLPALRDPDRFQAWAYRLLVNACYRESKRERRWSSNMRVLTDQLATGDVAGELADRDELERAFRRISPEHRAVVVLHHYRALPLTEVAGILGIPSGTAYSRLHYAYREMRANIEADGRAAARSGTA
jgi:RNA polymerase sigma-70 factor (ECF subfamily)